MQHKFTHGATSRTLGLTDFIDQKLTKLSNNQTLSYG